MPLSEDNVVKMPLVRLATQIKAALMNQKVSRESWKAASFDLCIALAEARAQFTADRDFGQWFDKTIGADGLNHQDRAAAIAMGREPAALRNVLDATARVSIQHIYGSEFSRFTHVSKPKRSRKAAKAPAAAKAAEAIQQMEAEGVPVTNQSVAARAGVSVDTAERAGAVHAARKEALADALPDTSHLSEKSKLTLTEAIRIYKKRLDREFEARVAAEVEHRIRTADGHVRQRLREQEKTIAGLEKILRGKGVFTHREFRELQMAVHPDNTASTNVRNRLLDILVRNEGHLVKRD